MSIDQNQLSPTYYINPYGERVNFSLQGKFSIFRNSIVTPGTTSFNKQDFCKDILNIFAANKVAKLSLVVVDTNPYHLQLFLDNIKLPSIKSPLKEAFGFVLDENRSAFSPFHFRGLKNDIPLIELKNLLLKHSRFSIDKPSAFFQFLDKPDRKQGRGGDKYFSQFIITTKLANNQTFMSSFYSSAKYLDLSALIKDFQPFSLGQIVSVSRILHLENNISISNKDLSEIKPYGVTGIGEIPHSSGSVSSIPFILEWVDKDKVWKEVEHFLKKYLRIRNSSDSLPVKHIKISKNYPIEAKHSKREFAAKMRYAPTQAEEAMDNILKSLKIGFNERFKRQISIAGYIADFYSVYFRLAIEVDGKSHLTQKAKSEDKQKEIAFYKHQIMTIRITNQQALEESEQVKSLVQKAIDTWRHTPVGKDPWSLSDEEIYQKIIAFRANLLNKNLTA